MLWQWQVPELSQPLSLGGVSLPVPHGQPHRQLQLRDGTGQKTLLRTEGLGAARGAGPGATSAPASAALWLIPSNLQAAVHFQLV